MADKYLNLSGLSHLWGKITTALSGKQDKLVSGTNIKTVDSENIVGSGNITTYYQLVYGTSTFNETRANLRSTKLCLFRHDVGNEYNHYAIANHIISSNEIDIYAIIDDTTLRKFTVTDANVWSYVDIGIGGTVDQTYDGTSANAQSGTAVASAISNKMDLVGVPINGNLVECDASGQVIISGTNLVDLLNDVEAGKEAFMLKDFNQQINITIPHCNQDIANTSIPNVDIDLNDIDPTGELNTKYAIASLMKYEVFDATSGGNRLNCWPVCSFSMNSQRTLRLRMMVAGSTAKTARRIQGALLLKHR